MALIQGIPVKLYQRTKTGEDAFHSPVYEEIPTIVDNVLVFPAGDDPVSDDMNLRGKRMRYSLCIPKGDTHIWENRTVEFFGKTWTVIGLPEEWISGLTPLGWNKRVQVERYGKGRD